MLVNSLAIVGALAFGIVSIALGLWVVFTLWYTLWSNTWQTTPGSVTDSRVASNRRTNGLPGYHYVVAYEFAIRDEEYRSTRVRFGDFRYLTRRRAERMIAKYPAGSAVTVYYHAAFEPVKLNGDVTQPVTVLEPGFNAECFYPIIAFLLGSTLTVSCLAFLSARMRG
jgi:Protein of unknown function (DUF3592)